MSKEELSQPVIYACVECGTLQKCFTNNETTKEWCKWCLVKTTFADKTKDKYFKHWEEQEYQDIDFYNSILRNTKSIEAIVKKRLNKLNKGQIGQ